MGQILVRQLDDATITRLKARARDQKTSLEALARKAINEAARLTADEKRALVRSMQTWSEAAKVAGVPQTSGVALIREDRDR